VAAGNNVFISWWELNENVHPHTNESVLRLSTDAVTSGKILNGQVGSVDIGTGQVASVDIGTGQVASVDIGDGQVATGDIANDAISPNVQIVASNVVGIPANGFDNAQANCPPGMLVTGGGYSAGSNVEVDFNGPEGSTAWNVRGINNGNSESSVFAMAVCIGPMP
jgi:hypothetical protein